MVFVSRSHMYAAYSRGESGPQVRLTGGMGAHWSKALPRLTVDFQHFLLVDVSPSNSKARVLGRSSSFLGAAMYPSRSDTDESQEID